jgi:hypothetical protein
MQDLTDPAGIVALAAAGVAVLALVLAVVLAVRVRRLRAAQQLVLGDGKRNLTEHAAELQYAFVALREYVEDAAQRLDARVTRVEDHLDSAVTYRALVRYDAYAELSVHQSMSLALLDARRNGVVLSSLSTRDHARLYCKQVVDGRGEMQLSPEEAEAIRLALAGEELQSVTLDT